MKLVKCIDCGEPIARRTVNIFDFVEAALEEDRVKLRQCSVESARIGKCKECFEKVS